MFTLDTTAIQFPHAKVERVPVPWLFIYAGAVPLGILIAWAIVTRPGLHKVHVTILGLFVSVILTSFVTDVIKNAVGRPRPDLIDRCQPVCLAMLSMNAPSLLTHIPARGHSTARAYYVRSVHPNRSPCPSRWVALFPQRPFQLLLRWARLPFTIPCWSALYFPSSHRPLPLSSLHISSSWGGSYCDITLRGL